MWRMTVAMMMIGTYKNTFVNKNLNSIQRWYLDMSSVSPIPVLLPVLLQALKERCLQNALTVVRGPWAEPSGF